MSPKRTAAAAPAPADPTAETAKNDEAAVSTAEEAAKAPDDDGPPPGAAEVGGDEGVSGLEPDPKPAGGPPAAGATETATASGVGASAVLGKLADDANSRITTVQADASFTNLALPERFKACPNLKKGDDEFVFAKLLPNALLFNKEIGQCADGISLLVTYSAYAPRPPSYEAPVPIEGAIYPFTAMKLKTRSYGIAGETKDVVYCSLFETEAGCSAVVYGIDSEKMEEHLLWRVLSPVLLEPLEPALTTVVLKGYVEWHARKMLGFTSGADARAQRAAATAAAAASAAAAAELSKDLKVPAKAGAGTDKAAAAAAAATAGPGPDQPPLKDVKMSKAETRSWFPSANTIKSCKRSTPREDHNMRIRAGCRAFGLKAPESHPKAALVSFLLEHLGFSVPVDDDDDDEPPAKPRAKPPAKPPANPKPTDAPDETPEADVWVRTPCSATGAFYFVHKVTGEAQWEVPEELAPPPKKNKPAGPPPRSAFDNQPPLVAPTQSGHQMEVSGSGGRSGGGGLVSGLMQQLHGSGTTFNLTVNERGAFEGATIYDVARSSQQQIGARQPQGQPLEFGMMTPGATPQQPQQLLSYLPQRSGLPSHVSQQHVDPPPMQHERQLPHQHVPMQQQNGQQQNMPNGLRDGQQMHQCTTQCLAHGCVLGQQHLMHQQR